MMKQQSNKSDFLFSFHMRDLKDLKYIFTMFLLQHVPIKIFKLSSGYFFVLAALVKSLIWFLWTENPDLLAQPDHQSVSFSLHKACSWPIDFCLLCKLHPMGNFAYVGIRNLPTHTQCRHEGKENKKDNSL